MAETTVVPAGWLRHRAFDLWFIVAIAALAIGAGALVTHKPGLFGLILVLDLWLLGYHHVIATFTRLCFDRQSYEAHRFLLFGLPPLIVIAVVGLIFFVGAWTIPTIYLYWQWFHYTRQSYGISQVYRRKSIDLVTEHEFLSKVTFYLLPLWGILHRSYQAPERFLGMELKILPVPGMVVDFVGLLALAAIAWWIVMRLQAWRRGRFPLAHTLYMLSHFSVFLIGYYIIDDITHGWLVINIWHNAQYIVFVWLFNNNKYNKSLDSDHSFLSKISQNKNIVWYFIICFAISTIVYVTLDISMDLFVDLGPPLALIVYQSINFHHYVVDGMIWKIRRKTIAKTLGVNH